MMKLKHHNIVYFAIMFIALLLEWFILKYQLDITYPTTKGTLIKGMGDVALILLPYWFLNGKWRGLSVAFVWMFSAWIVVNLTYFRFWGDLIPIAAISMGGNVDGNLIQYGLSLLKPIDIWFIVIPAIVSLAYGLIKPWKGDKLSIRKKLTYIGVSLAIGCIGQISYFRITYFKKNIFSSVSIAKKLENHYNGLYFKQTYLYETNGMAVYGIRYVIDMLDLMSSTVNLTTGQRCKIAAFLEKYERGVGNEPSMKSAMPINVVYIIVESLNAEMLDKEIGGLKIMPTLDSLARMEGTVLFDNVVSQIKASGSSDGHLVLMTGILPPDKLAYSLTCGSTNKFPSLADALPHHHKYLFLADDGSCWNEAATLQNFGLGKPVTTRERDGYDIQLLGHDGALFCQAMDMVKTLAQPFFVTMMTYSMHIPFMEPGWEMPKEISEAEGMDERSKKYANVCYHTDRYMGEFIRSLPENTIVFIASDHSQGATSQTDSTPPAVFMAVNTKRTQRISRTVGQVNLFPATLDILEDVFGRNTTYGGLAPSAFNPLVDGSRDANGNLFGNISDATLDTLNTAYRISDLIIRGDYFK